KVAVGDLAHRHDAGAMHDHIDAAEGLVRRFEQRIDIALHGHIGFNANRFSTVGFDRRHSLVDLGRIAGIVRNDSEPVLRETQSDGAADPARRADNNRSLLNLVRHVAGSSDGYLQAAVALAASSISAETSAGFDAKEACPAASVIVLRAPRRVAMRVWFCGWIIRSSLDTWYQEGLLFHAGVVMRSPNVLPTGAFCVTAMTN